MKKRRKRPPMAPEQLQRHIGRLRIGDLNKLFGDRYGGGRVAYEFPDDDAGREDLEIIAHHYAINNPHKLPSIIKLRAPWMEIDEVCHLVEQINTYPRQWRAETLGRKLRVTKAEWQRLRLRTIAPVGMTKAERLEDTKIRHRLRMRTRRRREGKKPRAEWLAENNISKTKPWEAEGICRRTWERRRAKAGKTAPTQQVSQVCRNITVLDAEHTLATSEQVGALVRSRPSGVAAATPRRTPASQSKLRGLDAAAGAAANACNYGPVSAKKGAA